MTATYSELNHAPPHSEAALHNGAAEVSKQKAELARYLPHLVNMSVQVKQTALQIEESVVAVCKSFQGIAERSKSNVNRTVGFLGRDDAGTGKQSFEALLQSCGGTMQKIMNITAEAGELSLRAIERIEQMEKASQQIDVALRALEQIATGNNILALNAQIEAARSGSMGAGFAAVAVELTSQTAKSRQVATQVGDLSANLRQLAQVTLEDLRRMSRKDRERVEQCRREVDESIHELHVVHEEMKSMLSETTKDGSLLANDITSAIRGLQFQDRTNQRLAHVAEDIDSLQQRLAAQLGPVAANGHGADEGFSVYTMREERAAAGLLEAEAEGGDVELF